MPTIAEAISRADPGDAILVDGGTYPGGYVVPREKHDLTIRGVNRNSVVLDGENTRRTGVVVRADGVSILNLSAHDFPVDGFRWEDADRFRASYLTVWNVGQYGIYVEGGEHGSVDHDYMSGAGDAAYYVGECARCDATVAHDPGPLWRPSGNVVSRNTVSGSGIADLALANGVGPRNCLRANAERTSLPPRLDGRRCTRTGDAGVTRAVTAGTRKMFEEALRRRRPPEYTEMPEPPAQPSMP